MVRRVNALCPTSDNFNRSKRGNASFENNMKVIFNRQKMRRIEDMMIGAMIGIAAIYGLVAYDAKRFLDMIYGG